MSFLKKSKINLLFLVVFTLPMYMFINNVFLGLYILVCLVDGGFVEKRKNLRNNYKQLIPIVLFFCLALIASINNAESFFLKYAENYWSFFLIPLVASIQSQFYKQSKAIIFKGLIYGSAVTLIICYVNVFYEMILNSEPLSYVFRWRHLGHGFTEVADTHPAYLGLFILTSILYLLFNQNEINTKLRFGLMFLFSIGLFQLVSRTALLIYFLVILLFLFKRYRKNIIGSAVITLVVISILIVFFSFGSGYLKDRIFSSEKVVNDTRFERLKVSYQIFKENPVIGVGLDEIKGERKEKYIENGYLIAADRGYNAHNQFMEYLSINGILGGIVYIYVFCFLFIKSYRNDNYLFLGIFLVLFIANITESMLVRIKGIEYFALFGSLFLSNLYPNPKVLEE